MQFFKKSVIFLLINALAVTVLTLALKGPYVLEVRVDEFQAGDYNTAILGQSCTEVGINPYILDNETDKCYNFGRGGINTFHFYPLLKRINSEGAVKKVYLNIDYEFWNNVSLDANVVGGSNADSVYLIKESLRRGDDLAYVFRDLKRQELANLLFDYKLNAQTMSQIPFMLRQKLSGDPFIPETEQEYIDYYVRVTPFDVEYYKYAGRGFRPGIARSDFTPSEFKTDLFDGEKPPLKKIFDGRLVDRIVLESMEDLFDYCEDRGIEVICFTTAQDPRTLWTHDYSTGHDYFEKYCEDHGAEFYDLNYVRFEYLPRNGEDYVDRGGHMLGDLADRQTELLKEIIQSEDPDAYFETSYEDVRSGLAAYAKILKEDTKS